MKKIIWLCKENTLSDKFSCYKTTYYLYTINGDAMFCPTVVEKNHDGGISYDIYSRLLKDRIVMISGEINDDLASMIISQLLYLDSLNHEDISLYINSPGGSVTSGLAIFDTMNLIKSDVETIGIGMCASMGAFLLSSGTPKKRAVLPNTEVMIHEVLGGSSGQATDIKIQADHVLYLRDKLNRILAKNTNKSLKKINSDTNRDHYLSAKEAVEYGLVDKIIQS